MRPRAQEAWQPVPHHQEWKDWLTAWAGVAGLGGGGVSCSVSSQQRALKSQLLSSPRKHFQRLNPPHQLPWELAQLIIQHPCHTHPFLDFSSRLLMLKVETFYADGSTSGFAVRQFIDQ